eukprot:Hpha_TRINITY_DN15763_c5_g9::TRINITY_DN15763_c5_g9_i1::g.36997::m.36997
MIRDVSLPRAVDALDGYLPAHYPPPRARRWCSDPRTSPPRSGDTAFVRILPDGGGGVFEVPRKAVQPMRLGGIVPGARVRLEGDELPRELKAVRGVVVPAVEDKGTPEPRESCGGDEPQLFWLRALPVGESLTAPAAHLEPLSDRGCSVGARVRIHSLQGEDAEYHVCHLRGALAVSPGIRNSRVSIEAVHDSLPPMTRLSTTV